MAKKGGFLSTLLKIFGTIIGIIVLIVVGGYCYLKFAMGIDIIDISNKLKLLSQNASESEVISNSFEKEDGIGVLNTMFGENSIVTKEGDKYTFNLEAYVEADLQVEPVLSDKEVASLFALFLEGVDATSVGIDKEILDYVTLKQIKFSNISTSSSSSSVDVNYVFMADLASIKAEVSENNAIVSFFVNSLLPDKMYLSSTFNVEIPKDDYQNYAVTNKSFIINNLTQEQTNGVFDVLSIFSNEDLKETLPDKLNTMFCDALFGGNGNRGLVGNIKSVGSVEFAEELGNIKIFIKKV